MVRFAAVRVLGAPLFSSIVLSSIVLSSIVLSAGCTTSRAVRAWHAGNAAEDAGKLQKARRKYKESYGRNAAHVGAELARLRLLATVAESRKDAGESLKELLKTKSDRPEVLIFAAWWSLLEGEPKIAADRLRAAHVPPKYRDAAALNLEKERLKRALAVETERKRRAADPASLHARRNIARSLEALQDGDYERARDLLFGVVAADRGMDRGVHSKTSHHQPLHWTVRFNLALAYIHRGELARAQKQLERAAKSCGGRRGDCAGIHQNLAVLRQ